MRALVRLMSDLLRQDTRTAVRTLSKHRGFTAFATLSLALGETLQVFTAGLAARRAVSIDPLAAIRDQS